MHAKYCTIGIEKKEDNFSLWRMKLLKIKCGDE